ncbi:MAG: bifunctional nicotinamidase/pyrazinamidase [Candidatus Omnitrophica bacterium]|nr:bifunctional nicotinamidase/pyrazinamidase [Candidatus Omnitrophota bacterium]
MKPKKALLIVDLQNDFCPGGALGIPAGDRIIPPVNKYIRIFAKEKLPVIASRDWHPVRTVHFRDFGGVWPVHCIQNSKGASFHPGLKLPKKGVIYVYKGMDPARDSYSVFQAEDDQGTDFAHILKRSGINELYIAGLATDYCVKFTARDALKAGYKVKVLMDAVRGVDLKPGDSEKAIKEITKLGAKKTTLKNLEKRK